MTKIHSSTFQRHRVWRAKTGMALVLGLAMIVLISALILAFYSYATANRQIENSRASQTTAEQVARSGLDYVTAEFVGEITNSAYSTPVTNSGTGGPLIYRPIYSTNATPITAVSANVSGAANATNFANLIQQSVNPADPNALNDGNTTATASENGRLVSTNRWNEPVLLGGSGFTATTQLPNWIYVDKNIGISTAISTTIVGRFAYNVYNIGGLLDANVAGFPSTETAGAGEGYNVLKSTAAGADLTNAFGALGVTQAAVDELRTNFCGPNPNGYYYTNEVAAFSQVGFLPPAATYTNSSGVFTTNSWLTYTNSTGVVSSFTNSFFMNRQDLLRYVATTNPGLTNALPYLTTFSRSLTAPSFGPTYTNFFGGPAFFNGTMTNSALYSSDTLSTFSSLPSYNNVSGINYYQANEDVTTAVNRFIPNVRYYAATASNPSATEPYSYIHYNDDGTYTTNIVNAGDPLIQRRFSLAKLAWITENGANYSAFPNVTHAQLDAAIQACFGLVWDSGYHLGFNSSYPADPAWLYIGSDTTLSTATAPAGSIETLDGSATSPAEENREPNFFELLKAGILGGSLGVSLSQTQAQNITGNPGVLGFDGGLLADTSNPDNQLIHIGVNLIDQYKSDSFPTAIVFGSSSSIGGGPYTYWGIEDLPYFHGLCPYVTQPNWNPTTGPFSLYFLVELWNPHQPSYNAGTSAPTNFEVRVPQESVPSFTMRWSDVFGHAGLYPYSTASTPVNFSVTTNAFIVKRTDTNPQNSYREPHIIRDPSQPTQAGGYNATLYCNPMVISVTIGTSGNYAVKQQNPVFSWQFENTIFSLDCQYPDGTMRPYTTFLAHEEYGGLTAQFSSPGAGLTPPNAYPIDFSSGTSETKPTMTSISNVGEWFKVDPRTFRFDTFWQGGLDANSAAGANQGVVRQTGTAFNSYYNIGGAGSNGGQDYNSLLMFPNYPEYVPANNIVYGTGMGQNGVGNIAYITDNDGITRPGDDYYWPNGTSSTASPVNPFQTSANAAGNSTLAGSNPYPYRPVMLNHPFTSVADMGYAFRDWPFKSLDFSSNASADAGLLDLFTLNDEPTVVAGKVDLNTQQPLVHQALLNAAFQNIAFTGPTGGTTNLMPNTTNNVPVIATSFPTNSFYPAATRAQLAQFISAYDTNSAAADTKQNLEAPVRALSNVVQTRTWNLLIDLVAQVGVMPSGASTSTAAAKFVVQGEKHYWLSIAIDRYTGKVIDQQLESVNE